MNFELITIVELPKQDSYAMLPLILVHLHVLLIEEGIEKLSCLCSLCLSSLHLIIEFISIYQELKL